MSNSLTGKRILVVDDESVMREVVFIMFEDAGALVSEASSGDEAVDMQRDSAEQWDLVCLDFSMPGRNGYETLLELRKTNHALPCVFISGLTMTAEVKQLTTTSPTVFLSKPFKEVDLIQACVGLLSGSR
jgi:CheY-like chemotaxis protein